MKMSDEALKQRTADAVTRAEVWLWSMQTPGRPRGIIRSSTHHDPLAWPDVLLQASYNGIMALDLIGALDCLSGDDRRAAAEFFLGFQRADGRFRMPMMTDDSVFKKPDLEETWRYIDFHVGNYSLGALQALVSDPPNLEFIRPFLDLGYLEAWLSRRDFRDAWQEGNNIVNLASFLLLIRDHGAPADVAAAKVGLQALLDWHDRLQEPATGFWGIGQGSDPERLLHAMAGATHNFHLFFTLGREIPYFDKSIDYCLTLPTRSVSACLDVDPIDILAHGYRLTDHRRAEVEAWLRAKLAGMLDFQSPDGGFADVSDGVRRLDGWVKGYEEPQGISNSFATYFRLIGIGMIASVLWPGWRRWKFRRMIGIGYFLPESAS